MTTLTFFVPGIPQTAGSKRAYVRNGRAIVTDDNKRGKDWRASVQHFALAAMKRPRPEEIVWRGPVRLDVEFRLPRPKSHYRSNGKLKPTAPLLHTTRPDRTKLLRCLEDALKGITWHDDGQVCTGEPIKIYDEQPGALVRIEQVPRHWAALQPAPELAEGATH